MWTLAVPDEKELNLESTLFQIKCMGAERNVDSVPINFF